MIYIDLSKNTLTFLQYIDYSGERFKESVICGIGEAETPSPEGIFMVKRKIIDPKTYYVNITPELYSSGVMELNISGKDIRDGEIRPYCIHGTIESNLGTAHTMGCITLKEDALKFTFNHIEKGEIVVIWRGSMDEVDLDRVPNWRQIKLWPPPKQSVSYRRNRKLF